MIKKKRINRKALSDVISTTLIILIVLAAVAIIGGIILKSTAGKSELIDTQIKLSNQRFDITDASIIGGNTLVIDVNVIQYAGTQVTTTVTTPGTPPDIDLVIVQDFSGSMTDDRLNKAKIATIDLIQNIIGSNSNVQIGLVGYNDIVVSQYSSDLQIGAGITGGSTSVLGIINNNWPATMSGSNPGTNTCAGIFAARDILQGTNSRISARKVIVLMSDGEPLASRCPIGNTLVPNQIQGQVFPNQIEGDIFPFIDSMDAAREVCTTFSNNVDVYTIGLSLDANPFTARSAYIQTQPPYTMTTANGFNSLATAGAGEMAYKNKQGTSIQSAKEFMESLTCGNGEYKDVNDATDLGTAYNGIATAIQSTTTITQSADFLLFVFKNANGAAVGVPQKSTEFPLNLYIPHTYTFNNIPPGVASVEIYPGAYLQSGQEVLGPLMDRYIF